MKNILFRMALAVGVTGLMIGIAKAQTNWSVTVDEYGNGSFISNNVLTHFSGLLAADPSGGTTGNVLIYTLPFNFLQTGDYFMTNSQEPLPLSTASDVIRFWGVNQIIFYSDTNGVDALADTGLPSNLLTPNVGLLETGIEDNDLVFQNAVHQAILGDPGYAGLFGGQGITYNFISEVPEPNPLVLGGAGGAALIFFRRLRSNK